MRTCVFREGRATAAQDEKVVAAKVKGCVIVVCSDGSVSANGSESVFFVHSVSHHTATNALQYKYYYCRSPFGKQGGGW